MGVRARKRELKTDAHEVRTKTRLMSAESPITTIITCMTDAEEKYILDSLLSVLRQTILTKVTICVDEDNIWIEPLLNKAGVRSSVTILRLPLAYLSAIRNSAVETVTTEFVAFLDADDVWRPAKLAKQLALLHTGRYDVIGTRHILVREDLRSYFYGFAREFPLPSSWAGRTSVFREHPFPTVRGAEDLKFWRSAKSRYHLHTMYSFLLKYRVRNGSLNSDSPVQQRKAKYAQLSEKPFMRPLLLAGSWLAAIALHAGGAITIRNSRK